MPKLLSVRKETWVEQFKPSILSGDPINPNVAIKSRYYRHLESLIRLMAEDAQKSIDKLYAGEPAQEYFAQDASVASQARILMNALRKKYDKLFADRGLLLAKQMVLQTDKHASNAVASSIQKLSGGLSLGLQVLSAPMTEVLQASIAENVGLIKSIPAKYMDGLQGVIFRSIAGGAGESGNIKAHIEHLNVVTLKRARFIARDQSRKANNDLAKAKAQAVGIQEGIWLHTGGADHPRKTHIAMSGKVFNLNEGLYDSAIKRNTFPGQEPGCRCRFKVVVTFD